ncbi:MAG: hypothetical protein ABUL73_06210 [Alphaproteobacteria bacterium]
MDNAERTIQRRIWLCIANSVAYAAWQGLQLSYFAPAGWATPLSLLGALVWAVTLVVLLAPLFQKRERWLSDERMSRNALRAMAAGYWCMLIATAVLLPLSFLASLNVIDIARAFAIVGVASPVFAFAMLERFDDRA